MNNKKKILIIYNFLLHYRKPLFNFLSKDYDVTVLHSGKQTVSDEDLYNEIIVPIKNIGPFKLQIGLNKEIKNNYNVIIALFDLSFLYTIYSIFIHCKSTRFILWGAWFTNSLLANKIRLLLTKKVDASIYYTYQSMQEFVKRGINQDNLYVANNTVDVGKRIKAYENNNKTRILFVGSLDKRKENDILIKAFANIIFEIPEDIVLTIIGDGPEYEKLRYLTKQFKIEKRVIFLGRINEPERLKKYYTESILSVSYGQAGLSVLQAMGFGVPFLTKNNAVSGGEITNIKHGINGLLCTNSIDSLENTLIYATNNIKEMQKMGENAYYYYTKYCTIENYALGFKDAIENTRNANVDYNL